MIVTRFAPSPTGYLHLGHAYSALFAYRAAQKSGGRFLLRTEDIDPTRCKPEFTTAIFDDLAWLGLTWEQPVLKQSEHLPVYAEALATLKNLGVIYPCFCTRREIEQEAAASGYAPHGLLSLPSRTREGQGAGQDVQGHPIYPGTCRALSPQQRDDKIRQGIKPNWRLDVAKAMSLTGSLSWHDAVKGNIMARPEDFGDVVLARKEVPTSYHLSVTVDDAQQGVTLVTRGEDLFCATDIHRLLQALLGYATPDYHHHALMVDETGKRYAKRDRSVTLRALRDSGVTPGEIRQKLGIS